MLFIMSRFQLFFSHQRVLQARFANLNFAQIDGLHEPRGGRQLTGIERAASGRNDLTAASVNRVCVQGDVINVEANGAQIFIAQNPLFNNKRKDFRMAEVALPGFRQGRRAP